MAEGYAINYNGCKLEVLRVWQYNRTPIWNGPDYLYTQHEIYCRCLFHPNAVAYRQPGVLAAVVAAKGQNVAGAETDAAIRHFLSQPRKLLLYTIPDLANPAVDRVILRSPQKNRNLGEELDYPCDAANGPFPKVLQVAAVKGTKSFLVDFAVTTFVNECTLYVSTPSVMLSHRWTMAEDIDQDFFTTRTIRGHAVFRTDRLLALGARADDYRDYFLAHPVPTNFKRDRVSVLVAEDGASCDYVCIDRERAEMVYGPGITRVEATFGCKFSVNSPEQFLWETTLGGMDAALAAANKISMDPVAAGASLIIATASAARLLGVTTRNALPLLNDVLTARVWGHKATTRRELLDAINWVVQKFFASFPAVIAGGVAFDYKVDLSGRYAELNLVTQRGPVQGAAASAAAAFILATGKSAIFIEDIPGLLQHADTVGMNLPSAGHTRGSYLTGLFTATLEGSCGVPAKPTEPANDAGSLSPP